MFCPNCGCNNSDYVSVCARCGSALPTNTQQHGARQQQPQPPYQPQNQQSYQQQHQQPYQQQYQQPYQQPYYGMMNQPAHPMKWFKFLIYFALFFSAFSNLVNAFSYFSGSNYVNYLGQNISDQFYAQFPSLQTLDIVMGIICILFAAFAIVVRFRLSGYRKDAGNFIFAFYIANAAVNFLYSFAAMSIQGLRYDDTDLPVVVIASAAQVVIAFCNLTYFKKRSDLFTN